MNIMSIAEILNLLRTQALLRAQENDEAGILLEAADEIAQRVLDLGQPLQWGKRDYHYGEQND